MKNLDDMPRMDSYDRTAGKYKLNILNSQPELVPPDGTKTVPLESTN